MNNPQYGRTLLLGRISILALALCYLLLSDVAPYSSAQGLGPFDRDSARAMLDAVKDDLKKNYYDPDLRGMNLDVRISEAGERIKQAQTRDQLIISIAQILLDLNDSHTFFLPPFRAARVRYGWNMQMLGNACFITDVNPKSDAAIKGLRAGDTVLAVDGYRPTHDNLWKMYYRYYALIPASSVRLSVRGPSDVQGRQIEVQAKVEKTPEVA
jgi:C-terminal processing protease CtpA/Prc